MYIAIVNFIDFQYKVYQLCYTRSTINLQKPKVFVSKLWVTIHIFHIFVSRKEGLSQYDVQVLLRTVNGALYNILLFNFTLTIQKKAIWRILDICNMECCGQCFVVTSAIEITCLQHNINNRAADTAKHHGVSLF